MAAALLSLQQLQVQQESWELSLSEVIHLLYVYCVVILSLSLKNMDSLPWM